MIPAPFDYERAGSVDEAISLLGEGGDGTKLLAGGHSLLPLMKLRLAQPSLLVDVGQIDDLSYVRDDGDAIAVGALSRHHDLADDATLREHCGLLADVAGGIGDPQVRHRGTIGGAIAHGDPASDVPTALLALGGEVVARGPGGERTIPAGELFTGLFETALEPDEILTEVRVPKLGDRGWHYEKFTRRALDWAVVGVAVVVDRDDGAISDARVALTNMGATPLRATTVEEALRGAAADDIAAAADGAGEGTSPPSDAEATADFRQHLARVLTRRAVEEALGG